DDIPAAAHSVPPLTTICVDKEALGARGVELLLEEAPAELEVRLPVQLVPRASTAVSLDSFSTASTFLGITTP
ncbi:MAG TPA: substrate-binding domain-containing protein, partial [Trinickia sp.]|nr:substrate-binding domain-containing protein [Trinickia sp.]